MAGISLRGPETELPEKKIKSKKKKVKKIPKDGKPLPDKPKDVRKIKTGSGKDKDGTFKGKPKKKKKKKKKSKLGTDIDAFIEGLIKNEENKKPKKKKDTSLSKLLEAYGEYDVDASKDNCLTCSLYTSCTKSKKSFSYICSKHKPFDMKKMGVEEFHTDLSFDSKYSFSGVESKSNALVSADYDFDIISAMDNLLESESILPPDIRIDDRDIKEATNIYEYITSKHFLDGSLYAVQFQMALEATQEYCPKCSDMKWYRTKVEVDTPLEKFAEKMAFLHNGKCRKCGSNKSELLKEGLLKPITEMVACIGQRAGKSFTTITILSYMLHKLLKLSSPSAAYRMDKTTSLHGTFVALTFGQAKETMYDQLYDIITKSPWFSEYNDFLNFHSNKLSEELYSVKDTFARYRHRNLLLYPTGPDQRKLRGKSRIFCGIDELAWFISSSSNSIKYDADEIHTVMSNSMETAIIGWKSQISQGFYNLPTPLMVCISSPSSKKDKIMRLLHESRTSDKLIGFHKATWEVNPLFTREHFKDTEKNNPTKFWRDFGAIPPLSSSPFLSDEGVVEAMVSAEDNAGKLESKAITSPSGKRLLTGVLKTKWEEKTVPRLMAIDAGSVNNSFGFAIGHVDSLSKQVKFDYLGELIPKDNLEISFSNIMDDVISELIERYNVLTVVSDRWQNIKLLQDLEREHEGIETYSYSLKYNDFENFRMEAYNANIEVPKSELALEAVLKLGEDEKYPHNFTGKPVSHFLLQCLTVRDLVGKTVEKGEGLTDDIFRAVVLAHSYLSHEDFKAQFLGRANRANKKVGGLGTMMGRGSSAVKGGQGGGVVSSNIGVVMSGGKGGMGGGNSSIGTSMTKGTRK